MFGHFRANPTDTIDVYEIVDSDGIWNVTEDYILQGLEEGWLTRVNVYINPVNGEWHYQYRLA